MSRRRRRRRVFCFADSRATNERPATQISATVNLGRQASLSTRRQRGLPSHARSKTGTAIQGASNKNYTAVRRQATTTLAWSITSGAGVHCQPAVLHTPRPSSEFDSVTPWDLVRRIDCDWMGESVQKGESGNSCILFIKFITLYVAVAKRGNSAILFIRLSRTLVFFRIG